MFADDTKVWTIISAMEDGQVLQEDLDNLMSWPDLWKLGFSLNKIEKVHRRATRMISSINKKSELMLMRRATAAV